MPKKASKKKAPKPLPTTGLLWALFLVNVLLGLALSSVTSARHVRVVGASASDQERIRTHLQVLRGIPCLRSNLRKVETLIQAGDAVEVADFTQNLFARGILKIQPRQVAARIEVERPTYLSKHGDIFNLNSTEMPQLRIKLTGLAKAPNLSFSGAWQAVEVAHLSNNLPKMLPNSVWTLEVDGIGVLSLYRGSGARIVLGSSDDMDAKLETLSNALKSSPGLLERVSKIDLTSPRAPVYTPKS